MTEPEALRWLRERQARYEEPWVGHDATVHGMVVMTEDGRRIDPALIGPNPSEALARWARMLAERDAERTGRALIELVPPDELDRMAAVAEERRRQERDALLHTPPNELRARVLREPAWRDHLRP